jgi:hypothetical protein
MIKIGDLVKHVHLGGIGIVASISRDKQVHKIEWLVPHTNFVENGAHLYFPKFLERL